MRIPVVFFAVAAAGVLAACGPPQQNGTTTVVPAVSHFGAVQSDHHPQCPPHFNYCMKLNPREIRGTTVCYPYSHDCLRSHSSYTWVGKFYSWPKERPVNSFNEKFYPDYGEHSLDVISEAHPVKSSHGRIGYEQVVCAETSSVCVAKLYIGIWTRP